MALLGDVFLYIKRAKIALILTPEGLKYPPEVRVEHETCSTICGTPVQAILDQKKLTGLAWGVIIWPRMGLAYTYIIYANFLASSPSRGP